MVTLKELIAALKNCRCDQDIIDTFSDLVGDYGGVILNNNSYGYHHGFKFRNGDKISDKMWFSLLTLELNKID